jgi:hypothetical protein
MIILATFMGFLRINTVTRQKNIESSLRIDHLPLGYLTMESPHRTLKSNNLLEKSFKFYYSKIFT